MTHGQCVISHLLSAVDIVEQLQDLNNCGLTTNSHHHCPHPLHTHTLSFYWIELEIIWHALCSKVICHGRPGHLASLEFWIHVYHPDIFNVQSCWLLKRFIGKTLIIIFKWLNTCLSCLAWSTFFNVSNKPGAWKRQASTKKPSWNHILHINRSLSSPEFPLQLTTLKQSTALCFSPRSFCGLVPPSQFLSTN